ncbi:MAG: hypothetical protein DRJ61_05385 [Acidobacteria bacterium]|nr:MAG: hypothetical protein DRJ65_06930 [Acidobacteriota bacterium]RLE34349.1 MAG: hypothetical protein DRJ61_05385 [Acidobacteriota bacterium]
MVGTGALNRLMILSKPDLLAGFHNSTDKRNVGVHEFAHLVDKSDGTIDGLPGVSPAEPAFRLRLQEHPCLTERSIHGVGPFHFFDLKTQMLIVARGCCASFRQCLPISATHEII